MVDCGTLTVTTPEAPQAQISVASCDVSPATVAPDERVTISAVLENTGDANGSVTITYLANGQEIDSSSQTVNAGSSTGDLSESFVPENLGLTGTVTTAVELSGADAATARADGGTRMGLSRPNDADASDLDCNSCGGGSL